MTGLFFLATVVDLTAAIIIFVGALSERMRLYPAWHKVGLIVAVVGLVCQVIVEFAVGFRYFVVSGAVKSATLVCCFPEASALL